MDKTIVLLMYNNFFRTPFIYQPAYQYFFNDNITYKTEGVSQVFRDAFIQYYGNKLILKGDAKALFLNGTIECTLKIKDENIDIIAILEKYNITVYP